MSTRTTHPALPDADVQYPICGACGDETEHDGDSFRCYACRLAFDSNTLQAEYDDELDEPCGAPCTNEYHGDERIKPGWTFACEPCALPQGHTSEHWTPCTPAPIHADAMSAPVREGQK